MAASNFYDPRPMYFKNDATPAAGGSLVFTDPETDLAKDVYSDADLGTSLGNTIELDSAGRSPTSVFLDGAYNVELLDADDVQVWLAENVGVQSEAAAGLPDPSTFADGSLLGSDGSSWVEVTPSFVPDPTGQSGKYLGNDGELAQWTAFPTAAEIPDLPEDGVTQPSSSYVTIGDVMVMRGSGTAATNGTIRVTSAITFSPAFTSAPTVVVTPTIGGVTGDTPSASVSSQVTSISTGGATAEFFAGAEANSDNKNVTTPVTYNWIAFGEKTV